MKKDLIKNNNTIDFMQELKKFVEGYIEDNKESYNKGDLNYVLNSTVKYISDVEPFYDICGISLNLYLRNLPEVTLWQDKVIKQYNKHCCISGSIYYEIHHLTSFSKLIDEVLKELNLPKHRTIEKYSKDELKDIVNLFLSYHKNMKGVLLSKKIHKKFHQIYGNVVFNERDFKDFKKYCEGKVELDFEKIDRVKNKRLKKADILKYEENYNRKNMQWVKLINFFDGMEINKDYRKKDIANQLKISKLNRVLNDDRVVLYLKQNLNIKIKTRYIIKLSSQ